MRDLTRNSVAWWVVLAASAGSVWADGMMMPRVVTGRAQALVSSPKQEAVLIAAGQTVTVVLRTHFRADAPDLAWVVPVPAKPTVLGTGDDRLFEALDAQTVPQFMIFGAAPSGGGFGFGCGLATREAADAPAAPVRVEARGTAGVVDYVVLSASQSDALVRWLNTNGYAVPAGAAPVFDRYTAAGWSWLAMKLRPDAGPEAVRAPHPIVYRYAADTLVFPLAISQLSAEAENEVVLYIWGRGRYAAANWANGDLHSTGPYLRPDRTSPSGTNYEGLLREWTQAHDGRFLMTEFAGWFDDAGRYPLADHVRTLIPQVDLAGTHDLTRLRALVRREAMDRDITLVPVTGWGNVSRHQTVMRPASTGTGTSAPTAVALLALSGLGLAVTGIVPRCAGRPRGASLRTFAIILACWLLVTI